MTDNINIDEVFPMKRYRSGQKETISRILELFKSGTKYILLEAPTGSGKSAVGMSIAQCFNSSYYLAPQKFLMDQLTNDFGEKGINLKNLSPMIDLKGRNSYPCNYWERQLTDPTITLNDKEKTEYLGMSDKNFGCDRGECKRKGESKLDYCKNEKGTFCPYFARLNKAMYSKICLMNFHSFLFQSAVVNRFGNRELLIIDEAHLCEDVLMGFVEINISDRKLNRASIKFPRLDSVRQYINYFEEIGLMDIIEQNIKMAQYEMHPREEDEWKHLKMKYMNLLESDLDNWVFQYEEKSSKASRDIIIKPIFIQKYANDYLFALADHVLLMSATILSKNTICESLGIENKSAIMLKLKSTFPKELRPIHYRPSGSMSYKNKSTTLPKLAKDVDELCNFHKDEKGIIHTHTFEIAKYLIENCSDNNHRFTFQSDFNNDKYETFKKHAATPNSVIIAPAMDIGLSLDDDLGRFQIICKVPYPFVGDPQVKVRMDLSQAWFDWRTCLKISQSYGRIYRNDKDHGTTYILDSDFKRFFYGNTNLLPEWFKEAVVWE